MSFLASITLIAALGFAPWVIGSETPGAQFLFRVIGLGGLVLASVGVLRGATPRGRWAERAVLGCLGLVAVSLLSAAFSIHRGNSLEAMINLLAIAGLFLALVVLVRDVRTLRILAFVEVLAAIPVAAFGLLQHFRPDLLPPGNPYPGRALGPFGQPNRLGGYLIGVIPVAAALLFTVHDRALRGALVIALLVLALCLVATYSRGAWIGFAAGILVFTVLLVRMPDLAPRPVLVGAALASILIPALLYLPSILARVRTQPARAAMWNLPIDPEREGSGAMRRAVWAGALQAAARRPALGWGIDTFREAYDRAKGSTLKRLEAEGGRTADQAHSFYLKTLTERGALGLAALLFFLAIGVAAGLAAVTAGTPDLRMIGVGLLASTIALLVHAVLEDNLSLAPHGTLLAANLGLLVASAPHRGEAPPARARRWAAGVTLALALVALGLGAASVAAAASARDGAVALGAGQVERARERYAAATRLAPWEDRYAVARAEVAEAAARGGRGIAALREAEASYRHAIALNGSDPVTRHQLARLYLTHPDVFGPSGIEAADRELRLALDQNPYYAEIRNDLGVALLARGNRSGARDAFRLAGDGRREFVDPLLNLAALAVEDGDRAGAEQLVQQALERNPGSARAAAMREAIAGRSARPN